MKFFFSVYLGTVLFACSSNEKHLPIYGFCYQPLYWPSDCVEPEQPSKEQYQEWRKERYRQWKEKQSLE